MTKKQIAQVIRLAMAKKNINNKVLGQMIGCTPQTVSIYRSGEISNIYTLNQIATCCDMTLVEMLELAD